MYTNKTIGGIILGTVATASVWAADIHGILAKYQAAGAGPFDARRGEDLWRQTVVDANGTQHRCADCHNDDLRVAGKHNRTSKVIEPLAPSVVPSRLTDMAKVEKWLERNCKGTWGRVCTAQEKGDLLTWIATQ